MTRIKVTLQRRPQMWNFSLPRLSNPQLTELSDLAHGQFDVSGKVKQVRTDVVDDYLRHVFGRAASRAGPRKISSKLFLHVLSGYLYDLRLKTAFERARTDHRTDHLTYGYESLHQDLTRRTLDAIREAGFELPNENEVRNLGRIRSAKTLPALDKAAYGFLGRHADQLKRVQNNPRSSLEDFGEDQTPPELDPDRMAEISPSERSKGRVYLTVDDGPGRWTQQLLKQLRALKEKHGIDIPVTFFWTGANLTATRDSDERVQEALQDGHDVGVHGNLHHEPDLEATPTPEVLHREIEAPRQQLETAMGKSPRWLRFPGGRFSLRALVEVFKRNLRHVDWSVDPKDWWLAEQAAIHRSRGETEEERKVGTSFNDRVLSEIRKARGGDVILLHEAAPLKPADTVFGMPLTWSENALRREDIVGRQLRANARGQFLAENLEPIVDTLVAKKLIPTALSPRLTDYSPRYVARYMAKIALTLGGSTFFGGARRIMGLLRRRK